MRKNCVLNANVIKMLSTFMDSEFYLQNTVLFRSNFLFSTLSSPLCHRTTKCHRIHNRTHNNIIKLRWLPFKTMTDRHMNYAAFRIFSIEHIIQTKRIVLTKIIFQSSRRRMSNPGHLRYTWEIRIYFPFCC